MTRWQRTSPLCKRPTRFAALTSGRATAYNPISTDIADKTSSTMLIHPNFDPVAIHLGPLAVRWYGLMYLVGFILAIVVGRIRLKLPHVAAQGWTAKDIDDMM